MKHGLKISLILILGVFILYPALRTLMVSFQTDHGVSFANYAYLFETPGSLTAIKNTLILGILTVLICGMIGTFLAFFVHFFDVPFNRLLDKALMLPLVVPGLIIVFSFMQLYGESGLITKTLESLFRLDGPPYSFGGLSGILLVHAYTQYIYFYMNVTVAIKQLDRSVIEASMNLGASPWKVFGTIIYPFIKPALISSSILTFMTGIGSFSAPNIIGGGFKVLTTQILLSKANMYLDLAAAQVVILSVFAMSYLGLARRYERKASFVSSVRESVLQPVKVENKLLRALMIGIAATLVFMIFLPILTIVVLSFVKPGTWMIEIYPKEFSLDNYINIFTKPRSLAPFANSVKMALVASLSAAAVSVPAAYVLTKTTSRTRPLIEFMVMLPFAMPASAIAINMINGFSQTLLGTWVLLPLAYFVSLLPMAVRSISLSYQRLKNEYAEASKTLGAGTSTTFLKITLPLIAPGIWAGLLLVFIRSLGEYTISAFLYTASNRPISIAMVNSIFEFDIGLAMAYGALVLAMTFIGAALIRKLQSLTE
ncbi:ABC transporter permease [Acidaminobacter hydrogenoformans]|uniref:Iron(III) transport system permease protein n=1 Tax=Acidaminobacter hydrogenoformans DSM 2784 TaxID=1120920 RepID=A0A1G5RR27_9FIRM|nr:iron ABC transporter permease [Acidaminobacter hydrogenoformans]SCZ76456.1 iron(III) transport system permease protein [Acidaminobacter hydrogenoformans DSM 2784]